MNNKYTNIITISKIDDLEKYATTINKTIWKGTDDEYNNFYKSLSRLDKILDKVFGKEWATENKSIYNELKEQKESVLYNKYNSAIFKDVIIKLMNEKGMDINNNLYLQQFEAIMKRANEANSLSKFELTEAKCYTNFFGEQASVENLNVIGLPDNINNLKYSFDDPANNLLILDIDLKLPKDSILDVYGDLYTNKKIDCGLLGCRNMQAKDIDAIKIMANEIACDNITCNGKDSNIHFGFGSVFEELTFPAEIQAEAHNLSSMAENMADCDLIVGRVNMFEPQILDSFDVYVDALKKNMEVNFDIAPFFAGGKLDVKSTINANSIWADATKAKNISCSNIIIGTEKPATKINDLENKDIIKQIYNRVKEDKSASKVVIMKPNAKFEASYLECDALKCSETVVAGYIKGKVISGQKIESKWIDCEFLDSESVVASEITSDKIFATDVKADKVKARFVEAANKDIGELEEEIKPKIVKPAKVINKEIEVD